MEREARETHAVYEALKLAHDACIHDKIIDEYMLDTTYHTIVEKKRRKTK